MLTLNCFVLHWLFKSISDGFWSFNSHSFKAELEDNFVFYTILSFIYLSTQKIYNEVAVLVHVR